jgi:predicted small secreted protein
MKMLIVSLCLLAVLSLSACNTVAGMGRDTRAAGNYIEHASGH